MTALGLTCTLPDKAITCKRSPWVQLTDVKAMLGCTGETRFLLGCISQLQDGSYFLEDMTGSLQLDLSDCQTSSGLYTGTETA